MQFLCNAVGWLGFGWFPSRKIAIASDRRLASSATSYYLLASYSILLTVLAYWLRLFRSLPIHTKYIVKLPLAPFNHVHIGVCCGPCCEGMERIDWYIFWEKPPPTRECTYVSLRVTYLVHCYALQYSLASVWLLYLCCRGSILVRGFANIHHNRRKSQGQQRFGIIIENKVLQKSKVYKNAN